MADMCTHTGTPTTERGNLKSAHGGSKFSLTVLPSTMNFARRPSTFYLRVCKTGQPALPDPPGLCLVCSGRAHGGGPRQHRREGLGSRLPAGEAGGLPGFRAEWLSGRLGAGASDSDSDASEWRLSAASRGTACESSLILRSFCN